MLNALITSKTRIKLMLKFFLNSSSTGYLRGLESEFGESTNSIRIELNRFEEAGLITSTTENNKKVFQANKKHPLFPDIHSLMRKYAGIDKIVERVMEHLGEPEELYLIGDLAKGIESPDLNLIIVGENIDLDYLQTLVDKAQQAVSRSIKYAVFTPDDFAHHLPHLNKEKLLRVWQNTD